MQVNKNFNQIVFLCREVFIVFFGKSESLFDKFQHQLQKVIPWIFHFFPHEIFFPKCILKSPGKKLGQFLINRKACIWTSGKVG